MVAAGSAEAVGGVDGVATAGATVVLSGVVVTDSEGEVAATEVEGVLSGVAAAGSEAIGGTSVGAAGLAARAGEEVGVAGAESS